MSRTTEKLEALIGPPRRAEEPLGAGRDAVRLVSMVESAAVTSSPSLVSPGFLKNAKQKKVRGHRRIDWLNVGAAAIAIVVAVGAAAFTGVQMASATPAAGAVQILETDEETLAGAEQAVAASKARLEETIATGLADAAAVRKAVAVLAESEEQPRTADAEALAKILRSVDAYKKGLSAITVPEAPTAYERGAVDTGSLQSVGDAIDKVQESSDAVDVAAEELRTARAKADELGAAFTKRLAAFAASFRADAQAEVEAFPVAGQEFRDAVVAAAAAIEATPLTTADGAKALRAYRDAVIALHDDDYRARVAAEEALNNEQNNTWTPPTTQDPGDSTEPDPEPEPDPKPTGQPEERPSDDDSLL